MNALAVVLALSVAQAQQAGPRHEYDPFAAEKAYKKLRAYEKKLQDLPALERPDQVRAGFRGRMPYGLGLKSIVVREGEIVGHLAFMPTGKLRGVPVSQVQLVKSYGDRTWILRGANTKGLTDGALVSVNFAFEIKTTRDGAGTSFLIEPVTIDGKPNEGELKLAAEYDQQQKRELAKSIRSEAERKKAQAAAQEKKRAEDKAAAETRKREHFAAEKLKQAKSFIDEGQQDTGARWLKQVVKDYAGTAAAKEAEELLKGLKK